MAAESNTGYQSALGSALNRHAISFQSGAINSTSEMIPMGNYYGVSSTAGMVLPGNSSLINSPGMIQAGNSPGSLLSDSIPGLTHDTGLAVEWSAEEQFKLEDGLVKNGIVLNDAVNPLGYAEEPSILRYIKIAAMLRDKTVRDVALRCRWMTRKRRKAEEHSAGKKVNGRKDKLVESSSKINIPSAAPVTMSPYSLMNMMHHMDQSERMLYEVSGMSGTAKHLLEQNAQAFNQINSNLSTYKLQDNIDLFRWTRNNIISILNDMRDMPGIMSQMPPLPVSIDEDLANSILPNSIQSLMFGSPGGIHMKQEPRC